MPDTYTITATAGPNGSIYPPGSIHVKSGSDQTFSIVADTGCRIVDVQVDGSSVGVINSFTFTKVANDHTIHASFVGVFYVIIAKLGPNGTISPSGNVAGFIGSNQTFIITPNIGYHVKDVIVDSISQGPITRYTFSNIQISHTIEAYFEINIYTITVASGLHGNIIPNGIVSVIYDTSQTFTILPDTYYQIEAVLVDSVNVGAVSSYTFTSVSSNHYISASFISSPPETLIADAWKFYTLHDYLTAATGFDQAISLNQTLVDGYNGAGWSYALLSQMQTHLSISGARFQAGLMIDPTFNELKAGLSFVYTAQENYLASIDLALSVLQADTSWVFRRDTLINAAVLHLLLAQDYFAVANYLSSLAEVQILDPSFSADVSTIEGQRALTSEIELLRGSIPSSLNIINIGN